MKKLILGKYALAGITDASTDEQVMAALVAHFTAIETQAQTVQQEAINSMIAASASAKGKEYDQATKDIYMQIGQKAGIAALQTALGGVAAAISQPPAASGTETTIVKQPAVPSLVSMIDNNSATASADKKAWTWDVWQEKDGTGLEALEKNDFVAYSALYEAKYKVKPQP